jgi:hypothetical protein
MDDGSEHHRDYESGRTSETGQRENRCEDLWSIGPDDAGVFALIRNTTDPRRG